MASSIRWEDEHKSLEVSAPNASQRGHSESLCSARPPSAAGGEEMRGLQLGALPQGPAHTELQPGENSPEGLSVPSQLKEPQTSLAPRQSLRKGERGAEEAPASPHAVLQPGRSTWQSTGARSSSPDGTCPALPLSQPFPPLCLQPCSTPKDSQAGLCRETVTRVQENVLKHLPWAQAARRQVKIVFLPVRAPRPTRPLVRPGRTCSLSAQAIQKSFARGRPGAAEGWGPTLGAAHPQGAPGPPGWGTACAPGELLWKGTGSIASGSAPTSGRLLPPGTTGFVFPFVLSSAPSALFFTAPREYCEPHWC